MKGLNLINYDCQVCNEKQVGKYRSNRMYVCDNCYMRETNEIANAIIEKLKVNIIK